MITFIDACWVSGNHPSHKPVQECSRQVSSMQSTVKSSHRWLAENSSENAEIANIPWLGFGGNLGAACRFQPMLVGMVKFIDQQWESHWNTIGISRGYDITNDSTHGSLYPRPIPPVQVTVSTTAQFCLGPF